MTTLVAVENMVQDKQTGGDALHTYGEFEQMVSFRDGNHQNTFKDKT